MALTNFSSGLLILNSIYSIISFNIHYIMASVSPMFILILILTLILVRDCVTRMKCALFAFFSFLLLTVILASTFSFPFLCFVPRSFQYVSSRWFFRHFSFFVIVSFIFLIFRSISCIWSLIIDWKSPIDFLRSGVLIIHVIFLFYARPSVDFSNLEIFVDMFIFEILVNFFDNESLPFLLNNSSFRISINVRMAIFILSWYSGQQHHFKSF